MQLRSTIYQHAALSIQSNAQMLPAGFSMATDQDKMCSTADAFRKTSELSSSGMQAVCVISGYYREGKIPHQSWALLLLVEIAYIHTNAEFDPKHTALRNVFQPRTSGN